MNMKVSPWQFRLCKFMRDHIRLSAVLGQVGQVKAGKTESRQGKPRKIESKKGKLVVTEVLGEAGTDTTRTDLVMLGVDYITTLYEDRGNNLLLLTW